MAAIRTAADALAPELTELLQRAVRIPSVNPARGPGEGEGPLQALIISELRHLGARLDVWTPTSVQSPSAIRPDLAGRPIGNRPNVVGVFGPHDRPLRLILNSHADTVAPASSAWRHDPFGGELVDGWLYGVGAADAKGCLLTFLGALKAIARAGIAIHEPLAFESVVDEESSGQGTLACIERGYAAGGALVGEPTSLHVCPGSRGAFGIELQVTGRSAHMGVAWDGVNAIEKAYLYIRAFLDLAEDLDAAYRHPLWRALPMGHVFSVAHIENPDLPGAVPSLCRVRLSAGYMAGETQSEIVRRIERAFADVERVDPWLSKHPAKVKVVAPTIEAAAASEDHPLVEAMVRAATRCGAQPPSVHALSAGTDGRFLTLRGATPAINFGPGDMHRAHSPDEALQLSDFHKAVAWVAIAICAYCGCG